MFEDKVLETNNAINSPSNDGKRTYTVDEIQNILGISQPTAYALIKKDLFRSINIGRHIRISKKSFDEWLDKQD